MTARLAGTHGILSAAHYKVNLGLTRVAACHRRAHGGSRRAHRHRPAAARRSTPRPGAPASRSCPTPGMGPGLNVSLAAYAMSKLDRPREVLIWDGGLPQEPARAVELRLDVRDERAHQRVRRVTRTSCAAARLSRCRPSPTSKSLQFAEPVGTLEAFVTSGGLSTAPWTWKGTLERLENKTLRYPGHCARFTAYRDLGLLGQEPIEVGGARVVPRDVFHALLEPRIGAGAGPCPRRVRDAREGASGRQGGRPRRGRHRARRPLRRGHRLHGHAAADGLACRHLPRPRRARASSRRA